MPVMFNRSDPSGSNPKPTPKNTAKSSSSKKKASQSSPEQQKKTVVLLCLITVFALGFLGYYLFSNHSQNVVTPAMANIDRPPAPRPDQSNMPQNGGGSHRAGPRSSQPSDTGDANNTDSNPGSGDNNTTPGIH